MKKQKTQKKGRAARALSGKKTTATGATRYLVLWSQTMDDIPIALVKTEREARAVVAAHSSPRSAKPLTALAEHLDLPLSTPVCFKIIKFAGQTPIDNVDVIDIYWEQIKKKRPKIKSRPR